MTNPVEAAVAPVKQDAVARAEQRARDQVARIEADLAAADWDLNKAAPAPNSGKMSRNAYLAAKAKRSMYSAVVRYAEPSYRPGTPCIVAIAPDRVEKFVEVNREAAAAEYDAFVAKLVGKVGPVVSASLDGNHVWGKSRLTVTHADGSTAIWMTQQIVNVSPLGTYFNQWPTRKVG